MDRAYLPRESLVVERCFVRLTISLTVFSAAFSMPSTIVREYVFSPVEMTPESLSRSTLDTSRHPRQFESAMLLEIIVHVLDVVFRSVVADAIELRIQKDRRDGG